MFSWTFIHWFNSLISLDFTGEFDKGEKKEGRIGKIRKDNPQFEWEISHHNIIFFIWITQKNVLKDNFKEFRKIIQIIFILFNYLKIKNILINNYIQSINIFNKKWILYSVKKNIVLNKVFFSFFSLTTFLQSSLLSHSNSQIEIPVNLAQLIGIMHNICKVWGSNPGHHKKKTLK